MKQVLWRLIRLAHHADFAFFLPWLARLPLPLAYSLSALRGRINAMSGRDWRSMALGFRHIRQHSAQAFALLPGTDPDRVRWSRQRFVTETRDELEAQLVAARRLQQLHCTFVPQDT